jgi:hypothetical protein
MVRIFKAVGLSLSLSRRPRAPLVKLHTPLRPVPCGSQGKETSVFPIMAETANVALLPY